MADRSNPKARKVLAHAASTIRDKCWDTEAIREAAHAAVELRALGVRYAAEEAAEVAAKALHGCLRNRARRYKQWGVR